MLATRNAHKLRELRELLAPHDLLPLPEGIELPPEDGDSFAANAAAKARAAARVTGAPVVADDSGIEARALGGAPGIRSARYAGEHAADEENLAKLLREVPSGGDRRVAYVCVLACVLPRAGAATAAGPTGERELSFRAREPDPTTYELRGFEGRCEGTLAEEGRGGGGFGYDPAFVPLDVLGGRTMAELAASEKHAISHRARAARLLLPWLDRRAAD